MIIKCPYCDKDLHTNKKTLQHLCPALEKTYVSSGDSRLDIAPGSIIHDQTYVRLPDESLSEVEHA